MLDRRHALALGACGLADAALTPRRAVAQPKYPERPIRLVIPFVPGGITDVVGRQWANAMQALLGPVFVENKPGGSGVVGTASVAQAQSDGYTILLGATGPLIVNSIAASHAPYHPRDFAPIAILVVAPVGIVVNPSLPVQTLQDVADYAKANPGKLSYGSAGVGTINHLTGELFKTLTGTDDIVHIPYRGSGQSVGDLVSGQISMAIVGVTGQVLALHQAGKLKMLAVTAPARMTAAPDIPTAVEQGLPGMVAQAFFGLFAPAGTPDAIVAQISAATRAAMADDGFREKLIASGFEPQRDSSPEAARRFVDEEIARWTPVIRALGLKLGMRT